MDSLVFEHGRIMSPKREHSEKPSTSIANGKTKDSTMGSTKEKKAHTNGSTKPPPSSQRPKTTQPPKETTQSSRPTLTSLFKIPQPIKQLFETFPLQVFPPNTYPLRSHLIQKQTPHSGHLLFSWTTSSDPRIASFNPSCLAWQIYLRTRDLPFQTVASSNHAAAGARLPLLVVNELETEELRNPWRESEKKYGDAEISKEVGPTGLATWAAEAEDDWPSQLEAVYPAYMSLVENEIRRAWVSSHCITLYVNQR
jgi:metaxin